MSAPTAPRTGAEVRADRATLVAFCGLVALTQVLWLSFSPATDSAARLWGVDAAAVGDLTVLNPLAFVLLAWPAGRWVDRDLRSEEHTSELQSH